MSDQKEEKGRRIATLERMLVAAANGPKIEVSTSQIREVGLITVLRESD
jgi:hypothetical protein